MVEFCFNAFNQSRYVGGKVDLPTQIDAAAAAGFKYFGPDMYSLRAWLADGHSLQMLSDRLAMHDMRCWEIAAGLMLVDRRGAVATATELASVASQLQPIWVQINVGTAVDWEAKVALSDVCDILRPAGAKVAIEYLPFTPLRSIPETYWLVGQVGLDRAGILIDSWHHFRGSDGIAELDAVPLAAIAYVQFDDALPAVSSDLQDETLHRRTFPGEGEFDLRGFCDRLKSKGFNGTVSVEVLNAGWRERDIFEFARRAYETSAAFWS